jgi:hypothetical protein
VRSAAGGGPVAVKRGAVNSSSSLKTTLYKSESVEEASAENADWIYFEGFARLLRFISFEVSTGCVLIQGDITKFIRGTVECTVRNMVTAAVYKLPYVFILCLRVTGCSS